jgi:hypothetical protein
MTMKLYEWRLLERDMLINIDRYTLEDSTSNNQKRKKAEEKYYGLDCKDRVELTGRMATCPAASPITTKRSSY